MGKSLHNTYHSLSNYFVVIHTRLFPNASFSPRVLLLSSNIAVPFRLVPPIASEFCRTCQHDICNPRPGEPAGGILKILCQGKMGV
jgi:hypothetical protein